jgi:plastocyanin
MKPVKVMIFLIAFAMSGLAGAHEKAPHKKAEKKPISTEEKTFGREGDPKKVSRTVKIDMSDTMRFLPAELAVKQGETVRFDVRNT